MPQIVITNVSQTVAPKPNTFQQTGAIVSEGGTTLAAGSISPLITQPSDLTALLGAPLALSALAWSGGVVTATTAGAIPGRAAGDKFSTSIAGSVGATVPAGYNGLVLATVTGANTFTYPLASNPGAATTAGTYSPPGQSGLLAAISSYYSQGSNRAVYILELGPNNGTTGPTALDAWMTANPNVFYLYLVPKGWDAKANFLGLLAKYKNLSSKAYFFGTTTNATRAAYDDTMKDLFIEIEAPNTPLTEMSVANAFQHALSYQPSSSNRMTPMAFSFLFGVTPYPTMGNTSLLQQFKDDNVNYVGTGAEGGISTAIQLWGTMKDGNDFTYWFEVDWMQLEADLRISNAVINGSNNPLNPLYYDQFGINRLQDVVVGMLRDAIAFGIANGDVGRSAKDGPLFQQDLDNGVWVDTNVCNAVPFITYVSENTGDFKAEIYGGLSVVAIPQRGFKQVIFNINVTDFVAQG
jgi:hypothetical protein